MLTVFHLRLVVLPSRPSSHGRDYRRTVRICDVPSRPVTLEVAPVVAQARHCYACSGKRSPSRPLLGSQLSLISSCHEPFKNHDLNVFGAL